MRITVRRPYEINILPGYVEIRRNLSHGLARIYSGEHGGVFFSSYLSLLNRVNNYIKNSGHIFSGSFLSPALSGFLFHFRQYLPCMSNLITLRATPASASPGLIRKGFFALLARIDICVCFKF